VAGDGEELRRRRSIWFWLGRRGGDRVAGDGDYGNVGNTPLLGIKTLRALEFISFREMNGNAG
jgi:hypothetical protein